MSVSTTNAYDTVIGNGRSLHGQSDAVEGNDHQYWVVKPAIARYPSSHYTYPTRQQANIAYKQQQITHYQR